MKRFLVLIWLMLILGPLATAEPALPLPKYLDAAENICIAKVTSVDGYKLTFTVTDVLRGKPDHIIHVTRAGGSENYVLSSEWLLLSCSYGLENSVGWDEDRPAAWIPGAITHSGNQTYITDFTSHIPSGNKDLFGISWDIDPNGRTCLTLDHVKSLLAEHPYKATSSR
jgi:hypothetical protein